MGMGLGMGAVYVLTFSYSFKYGWAGNRAGRSGVLPGFDGGPGGRMNYYWDVERG